MQFSYRSIDFNEDLPSEGAEFWRGIYAGTFRLWAKDGNQIRSAIPFHEGGDLIVCDEAITMRQLRSLGGRFYIEGLHRFLEKIELEIHVDGVDSDGRIVILDEDSILSDSVTAAGVKIEVGDVWGWDPHWERNDAGQYGDGQLSFRYPPLPENARDSAWTHIGGAVTDGSALTVMTLSGWGGPTYDDVERRVSVRMNPGTGVGRISGNSVNLPNV